jgi:hypothetical protein
VVSAQLHVASPFKLHPFLIFYLLIADAMQALWCLKQSVEAAKGSLQGLSQAHPDTRQKFVDISQIIEQLIVHVL